MRTSFQSHKRMVPSAAVLTSVLPSDENPNVSTCCVCPSSTAILSPVVTSHNWIAPPTSPLTRIAPSGENINDSGWRLYGHILPLLCTSGLTDRSILPVATSQIRISLYEPAASKVASDEKHSAKICSCFSWSVGFAKTANAFIRFASVSSCQ